MSPRQRQVLEALPRCVPEPGYFAYIDTIAKEAGLGRRETRIAVRALARMGFARYSTVFTDDGFTAGSGYGITAAGRAELEGVA